MCSDLSDVNWMTAVFCILNWILKFAERSEIADLQYSVYSFIKAERNSPDILCIKIKAKVQLVR